MKSLFDETKLKNINLKNRFVRSATWEGLANDDGNSLLRFKYMELMDI